MTAPHVLAILHDPDDHLNDFAGPLAQAGLELSVWDVRNAPESWPALDSLEQYSGIISLGSTNGVQDEPKLAWMQHERKIVDWALETGTPFFGLCFGSQLLASAAGGTFKPSPKPELGWTTVTMAPEAATDPVLGALGKQLDAFHFHFDSFELPDSVAVLGETDGIIQAFRVGERAWGTQFHIEVGLSQQLAWLASYRDAFEKQGIDVVEQIRQSHAKWLEHQRNTFAVSAAFAEQVKQFAANRVERSN